MKLIAITGLAGTEKEHLTEDLARHFREVGASVTVYDRMDDLPVALEQSREQDYVILNTDESISPEAFYTALDAGVAQVASLTMDDVRIVALLDDRTCNCFPHVQVLLEDYADIVLRYPFTLKEVIARL